MNSYYKVSQSFRYLLLDLLNLPIMLLTLYRACGAGQTLVDLTVNTLYHRIHY
jgi:hypothetical protein